MTQHYINSDAKLPWVMSELPDVFTLYRHIGRYIYIYIDISIYINVNVYYTMYTYVDCPFSHPLSASLILTGDPATRERCG